MTDILLRDEREDIDRVMPVQRDRLELLSHELGKLDKARDEPPRVFKRDGPHNFLISGLCSLEELISNSF